MIGCQPLKIHREFVQRWVWSENERLRLEENLPTFSAENENPISEPPPTLPVPHQVAISALETPMLFPLQSNRI